MDGGWAPWNKVCQLSFTNTEERLMDLQDNVDFRCELLHRNETHIGWVDIALNDVKNTNVARCFGEGSGNHSVLWL